MQWRCRGPRRHVADFSKKLPKLGNACSGSPAAAAASGGESVRRIHVFARSRSARRDAQGAVKMDHTLKFEAVTRSNVGTLLEVINQQFSTVFTRRMMF